MPPGRAVRWPLLSAQLERAEHLQEPSLSVQAFWECAEHLRGFKLGEARAAPARCGHVTDPSDQLASLGRCKGSGKPLSRASPGTVPA